MANYDQINFGLRKNGKEFVYQYVSPSESSQEQAEARSVATTLGQEMEVVAAKAIATPYDIIQNQRELITESLHLIADPIRSQSKMVYERYKSIRKTFPRSEVIPFYKQVFETQGRPLYELALSMDRIHETHFIDRLETISSEHREFPDNVFTQTKICYLIDGLIIAARLTRDGVGEDLRIFGNLIPDIKIRSAANGNQQITQFDGLFLPKRYDKPQDGTSASEREQLIRGFAQHDHRYPDYTPPILQIPGVLEIKTLFRPRWEVGTLSRKITDYHLRTLTQQLGSVFSEGGIAIMPQNIIFLRLRSLGPHSIIIQPMNLEFYHRWMDSMVENFGSIPSIQDAAKEAAGKFMIFMENHISILQKDLDEKYKHNGNYTAGSGPATQKNLEIDYPPVQTEEKPKRRRLKKKRDTTLPQSNLI